MRIFLTLLLIPMFITTHLNIVFAADGWSPEQAQFEKDKYASEQKKQAEDEAKKDACSGKTLNTMLRTKVTYPDGTTRDKTFTCRRDDIGNADDSPEKQCRTEADEYTKELGDKQEKAADKIERRTEKIQDLERESIERQTTLAEDLASVDADIAAAEIAFNEKSLALEEKLQTAEDEGNEALQELISSYKSLVADTKKIVTVDRDGVVQEFNSKSRQYLEQCNINAQQQIGQAIQARNDTVKLRAQGQIQQKTVSGNFRTANDFERIKKNVNAELAKCRAAKEELELQANKNLTQLSQEAEKNNGELQAIQQKMQQTSEKITKFNQRLAKEMAQAGVAYQKEAQRLEAKKQMLQQSYVQQKALDDQQIAQLRNEQYGATPLLGQAGNGFLNGGKKSSERLDYDAILKENVKGVCCEKKEDPKTKRMSMASILPAGKDNRFIISLCKERTSRHGRGGK